MIAEKVNGVWYIEGMGAVYDFPPNSPESLAVSRAVGAVPSEEIQLNLRGSGRGKKRCWSCDLQQGVRVKTCKACGVAM